MLKQHNQLMLTFFIIADACAVAAGWLLSYWIRFKALYVDPATTPEALSKLDWLRQALFEVDPTKGIPSFDHVFKPMMPLVILAHLVIFWRLGLYNPRRVNSIWAEVRDVLKAFVVAVIAVVLIDYIFPSSSKISRRFILTYAITGTGCFTMFRISVRLLLRTLRRKGINHRKAAIIGAGRNGQRLLHALRKNTWTGIDVEYFVDDTNGTKRKLHGVQIFGPLDAFANLIEQNPVDAVFIALPADKNDQTNTILQQLETSFADVRIVPEINPFFAIKPTVGELDGVPILSVRQSPLYGWNAMVKRLFDIIVGTLCLLIASMPMILIGIIVKLTSRGPVFYKQNRVGLDGQEFNIVKFRSMRKNAEKETGAVMASTNDDRRTAIGRFLRRTSLDELPNLFNVLAGHMSLVGPRPERPELIDKFKDEIPRYMLRHKIKAGMTGYAQVRGLRGSATSLKKRIQHDVHYIKNWSLGLDMLILLQTVFGVWFSRHES